MYGFRFTICGLVLRLRGLPQPVSLAFADPTYREFVSFRAGGSIRRGDELTLRWCDAPWPDVSEARVLFDTAVSWRLLRWRGKLALLQQASPRRGGSAVQLTIIDSRRNEGVLYARPLLRPHEILSYNPLGYPLDELLIIQLLAQGKGVLFHACGADDNGEGVLFVGSSGAGKSTMARLWGGLPGVTLLSDERVVVRRDGNRFVAHGTPWAGEVGVASPASVPLRGVFVLEHGPANGLHSLSHSAAIAELWRCLFPSFWDRAGIAFALDFLAELTEAVPCHRLQFIPDHSAVDFVRCQIRRWGRYIRAG